MSDRRVRGAWLVGYALCSFLAFPHPLAGGVLDLGLGMAWLAPAALLLAIDGLAPRRAARLAFVGGLLAHTAVLHWIYVVTVTYGHAPVVVGLLAPAALAAYVAAFSAAFGGAWALLARWGAASPLAAALLWTVLDHLRSFALSGFPWATLGYAQHRNPALMGLAPFTGVYGLSFATLLGAAALAELARAGLPRLVPGGPCVRPRRARRRAAWALAGVAAAHAGGLAVPGAPEPAGTVRVAVLQGNIDQGFKWSPEWALRTLGVYEDLSRRAAARGAELIVWPETAVPGSIDTDGALRERLERLASETGAGFVLGAVGVEPGSSPGVVRFYDSAFLLDSAGSFRDRYDKAHLVPFGEYVPLQDLLGRFLRAVARGMASSRVTAGPGPRAVEVPLGRSGATVRAGVPICYELLFPDLVRRFAADGGGLLLAITNDAWYGRTGAPYQFLAITALRSAETRLWTARAANTGVSAFIDARGRVRARTPIFERGLLVADVPLHPAPRRASFYVRHGDAFAGACWAAGAALAGAAWLRHRRREGNPA